MANPMVHSTGMFRRELIEKCGWYDETLEGFQDWDVWLKLGSVRQTAQLSGVLAGLPDLARRRFVSPAESEYALRTAHCDAAPADLSGFPRGLLHGVAYHFMPIFLKRAQSLVRLSLALKKTAFAPKQARSLIQKVPLSYRASEKPVVVLQDIPECEPRLRGSLGGAPIRALGSWSSPGR